LNHSTINQWLELSNLGIYLAQQEKMFFGALTKRYGLLGASAQFGMPGWDLLPSCSIIQVPEDVRMAPEAMAWIDASLDLLILPHILECSDTPYQVLAESWRCLKPGGRVLLSGFNPHSLWRLGKCFDGKQLPHPRQCLPLPLLKRHVADLGFTIESGRFMAYVPPVNSERALRRWHFMEAAGNRWWPHAAAAYGVVLLKRQAGMTILPELQEKLADKENAVVLTPAKVKAD